MFDSLCDIFTYLIAVSKDGTVDIVVNTLAGYCVPLIYFLEINMQKIDIVTVILLTTN